MKTLTEMATEVSKVVAETDHRELILEMESKLMLIQHAISQEPRQLESLGFTGISYLISDIQRDLIQTEHFCEKAGSYLYFLNNSGIMVEINQAERKSAKRRNTQM